MEHCSGCNNSFQPRGFLNHLRQTRKKQCRAFLARLLKNTGSGLHTDSDEDGAGHDEDNDGAGYEEDDGAGAGASSEGDNDNADEEDEDDLLYLGDEYWPEVPVPAEVETDSEMDILAESRPGPGLELELGDDQQEEVNQARNVRWAAEEEFRKVPVVESFPSNAAGAPIANVQAVPKYESYQKDLKNDNPWAPFSSRLDWEVARWAKLRGPSSTAFTEFLNIDGVSA
jgi:hypothetical protein